MDIKIKKWVFVMFKLPSLIRHGHGSDSSVEIAHFGFWLNLCNCVFILGYFPVIPSLTVLTALSRLLLATIC